MKYVAARVKNGKLDFSTSNKKIRVFGSLEKAEKIMLDSFHLYAVSSSGGYLILEVGSLASAYGGPEEVNLSDEQAAEIAAAVAE